MPSPKSGKAGSAVSPAAPKKAQEADKADPGEMAKLKALQRLLQKGKYGAVKVKPPNPPDADEGNEENKVDKEKKKSWIEIELQDEEKNPVPGMRYKITLPDGETVAEGTLDDKGLARLDGIDSGSCKVTFPDLDAEAWERI